MRLGPTEPPAGVMVLIWRLFWASAVLSLWPLSLGAYVATLSPGSIERTAARSSPPNELPKRYTVCAIAGPEKCWEAVGKLVR